MAGSAGDYEAAAGAEAANGWPVRQCYLAGVDTTNETSAFRLKSISVVDGEAVLEWDPNLDEGGTKTDRRYRIQGKKEMGDEWGNAAPGSRFFRVWVGMPGE